MHLVSLLSYSGFGLEKWAPVHSFLMPLQCTEETTLPAGWLSLFVVCFMRVTGINTNHETDAKGSNGHS